MNIPKWAKVALVAFALFWTAGAIHGCVVYHARHVHRHYPWWDARHWLDHHDRWQIEPPK